MQEEIDRLEKVWRRACQRNAESYSSALQRIDDHTPSDSVSSERNFYPQKILYMTEEQKTVHAITMQYVEVLRSHEDRIDRHNALVTAKRVVKSIVEVDRSRR